MRIFSAFIGFVLTVGVCATSIAQAQPNSGAAEDARHTWDLTELYPSIDAWQSAREKLLAESAELAKLQGVIAKKPNRLFEVLERVYSTYKEAARLRSYASMLSDEDLRVTDHQELQQLATAASSRLSESIAWLGPEIQSLGEKKINRQLKREPRLAPYRFFLENSIRRIPHTLDAEGEKLLSLFGTVAQQPENIYSLLANADIPWPMVTMADGKQHRIDQQGYSRWRASRDRAERKKTFDAFWSTWKEYRDSAGATLNAHIQTQVALARARNYDSVLSRELFADNLPEAVYRTLVEEVNNALPTLHRYFELRGRILGVEQMHYYDIYPPLVDLEKQFDFETSREVTLEAMAILGDDWVARQREAMAKPWMHVYPAEGKRGGAYMNGSVYDLHPYVLLNHNDDYESLSTLAHEWGHVMHTLYAQESQPFATYGYATFIAEIPSTSLELILQNYMVDRAASKEEKIYYLGYGLENLRATFFRQTMFAEFELMLYETVERGEALTGEKISKLYGDLLKRYHGHDKGVVLIDDLYTNEWLFIPHFYYNMYVYQYATSVTAGTALYERMVNEGEAGVAAYIDLLRAGGSDYPYNLLTEAGVDLATPAPFKAVVARMNLIMDAMETLLESP